MNKKRTTFRVNQSLHQLIKEKSRDVDWSFNKYLNHIVSTYFYKGEDIDLQKRIVQEQRQQTL